MTKPLTPTTSDNYQTKVMAILDKAKIQAFKTEDAYNTHEGDHWSYAIKSEAVKELAEYIVTEQRHLLVRLAGKLPTKLPTAEDEIFSWEEGHHNDGFNDCLDQIAALLQAMKEELK